ncbi:hypothetical protein [Azospirillum endophyticum]
MMTTGGQSRQLAKARSAPSRLDTAARVTAAVFGAYGFAWGLASFGAELGALAGMAPAEAVTTSSLLALLVLPVMALWAFAVPRVVVGWAVLGGGGVLLTVAARLAGGASP